MTFVIGYFARDLNFNFFGWPFSFWVAAQGALIVYVLIIWYYAWYMNRLDHEYGVAEENTDMARRRPTASISGCRTGVFSADTQSAFKKQLNKVYGWYTGGFIAFIVVLAMLEQAGLPRNWIGFIFLFATVRCMPASAS